MKKIAQFFILALLVVPAVSSASINANLKYGAKGQAVIELQDLLSSEDCLSVSSSGYFGLLTLKGVKCFQAKYKLPPTGYFGTMSREKANGILSQALGDSNRAEKAETGIKSVVTPPALIQKQTSTTASGCTSTLGFSIISGQPCASVTLTPPTPAVSWTDIENQNFPQYLQKGALSITLANSLGEQHYYRLENGVYVQKNTHAAALEPFTSAQSSNVTVSSTQVTQISTIQSPTTSPTVDPLRLSVYGSNSVLFGDPLWLYYSLYTEKSLVGLVVNILEDGQPVRSYMLTQQSISNVGGNSQYATFAFSELPNKSIGQHVITVIAGDQTQSLTVNITKTPQLPQLLPLEKNTAYADQAITVPQAAYKLGDFRLRTGLTEGVNADTIILTLAGNLAATSTDITNVYVVYGTKITQAKTSIINSTGSATQVWSLNEVIPANSTMNFAVYADISSTVVAGKFTAGTLTVSGTGANSGVTFTSSPVLGQTITIQ